MGPRQALDFLTPAARTRSGDDPIFKLNAEARARAKQGERVINATLGALLEDDGTLATLPVVTEALAAIDPARAAAYAPIHGDPTFLRGVIQDLFQGSGVGDWAVAAATPGGSGALALAIQTFLEPNHAVLVPDLFWGPYRTMADQNSRRLETFTLFDAKGNFDHFAFERTLNVLIRDQGRALVFLNFPCNNPTGYSPNQAEWRSLAEILRAAASKAPVAVLVDHAYARFAGAGGDDWIPHLSNALPDVLLLVAWTASKSFAQYGARVGALVAVHPDPAVRERLVHAFGFGCRGTWSNCNHLGQLAISLLLTDDTLRARVAKERARLVSLLSERVAAFNTHARAADLRYPRYDGGFFVSVFCADAKGVAERAKERGLFVVPQAGSVRVALCATKAADIADVVQILADSTTGT
jgi:aromatic-amino-acid transaminase